MKNTTLLLLLLVWFFCASSQNIFIAGRLSQTDLTQVIKLIDQLHKNNKVKKILIQHASRNEVQIKLKLKKKKAWVGTLKDWLRINFDLEESPLSKSEIELLQIESEKQPLIYDKSAICPSADFEWLSYIERIKRLSDKKPILILNFNEQIPTVEISEKSDTVFLSELKLSGKVACNIGTIKNAQIKVNQAEWKEIDVLNDNTWTKDIELKEGVNHIEVKAVSSSGKSSEVETTEVVYISPQKVHVEWIYPNSVTKTVQNCTDSKDSYIFQFYSEVAPQFLKLIIQPKNKAPDNNKGPVDLSQCKIKTLSSNKYCVFVGAQEAYGDGYDCAEPNTVWQAILAFDHGEKELVELEFIDVSFTAPDPGNEPRCNCSILR